SCAGGLDRAQRKPWLVRRHEDTRERPRARSPRARSRAGSSDRVSELAGGPLRRAGPAHHRASRGLHRGLIDELPAFEGSAADSNPVGDRARALVVLQRHLADPRTRAAGGSNRRGFGTRHHPVGLAQVVAPTPSLRLADSRPPFGATENRRAPSGRSGGLPTGGLPAHRFRGLDAPRILRRALLL